MIRLRRLYVLTVLLIFMMPIVSGPSNFLPYASPENGFATSAEEMTLETISGFEETLPDDVLFYPDMLYMGNDTADADDSSGSWDSVAGTYADTYAIGGSSLHADGGLLAIGGKLWLQFDEITANPRQIVICLYAKYSITGDTASVHKSMLYDYDAATWDYQDDITTDYAWYNYTIYTDGTGTEYANTSIMVGIDVVGGGSQTDIDAYIDCVVLEIYGMSSYDPDSYAESFADVSDWTTSGFEAGDTATTDGDVLAIETASSGADYDDMWADVSINTEGYIEFRYKVNASTSFTPRIYLCSTDALASPYYLTSSLTATTWTTYRAYVKGMSNVGGAFSTIERIWISSYKAAAVQRLLEFDYLRISPADESGWQHDGSTTAGVVVGTGSGGTISTDGDYVSLIADADGSTFDFYIDTTATAAGVSPASTCYPFIMFQFHTGDAGESVRIQGYTSSFLDLQTQTTIPASGTMRYYWRAMTNLDVFRWRIWVYSSQTTRLDFVKAYNIANWTVTSGNCEAADYLYVSGSALYCSGLVSDANEYIRLDHDPAVGIDTALWHNYNLSTNANDNATEFYVTFYNGAWGTAQDDVYGSTGTGTISDLRLQFQGKATAAVIRYISALKFIRQWHVFGPAQLFLDMPNWHTVPIATLWFFLEIGIATISMWFVIIGLILIPVSTVYLVKGGREDLSNDKAFFALVLFFIGIAFFIGGII